MTDPTLDPPDRRDCEECLREAGELVCFACGGDGKSHRYPRVEPCDSCNDGEILPEDLGLCAEHARRERDGQREDEGMEGRR
jgi:hypothetical protein